MFEETIKTYKNVDILINNAGLMDDSVWEREIAVNVVSIGSQELYFEN